MAKGKYAAGSLQLADPALTGLTELQAKRDEENAELNRMAFGQALAPEPKPAKPKPSPAKPAPDKTKTTEAASKTKAKAPTAKAAVAPVQKTPLIEKPEPIETKDASLTMRIKRSELAAWKQAAKENGVSVTYLIEYVMGKYLTENA